ncbi:uncharacterized protein LOC119391988 [Rhipicephalus sanguineus]|uniref:uncharacterized protein LOC119391988 n=1 Tax=Rhipicephalus sanguineus TaxID=34632 RepID=UPI0018937065|nr:uncharacterized protein LOC119391988 [Rhipicephalus sanguineus]
MVKTEDQRMLRRNRQHLLRIPGNGTSEDQDQDTESPEDMFDRDAYKQPSEPLLMQPTPDRPWHRVGIDLFQFGGASYVIVYDAHSNFPDVEKLRSTTTKEVIDKISGIFSRYGTPVEVCTDNGPQFGSQDFREFAQKYDFQHITSSPEFPRSNGLAEKGVQIVKRILKNNDSHGDFWLGLLAYRSSPLEDGRSPGELLQGRHLRTTLPKYQDDPGTTVEKHRQSSKGKALPPLESGTSVRIHNGDWSRTATVSEQAAPRSYMVKTEDQRMLRRNRQHLLRIPGNGTSEDQDQDTESPEDMFDRDKSQDCNTPGEQAHRDQQGMVEPTTITQGADHEGDNFSDVRKSTRKRTEPRRLHYDTNFHQVS